MTRSLFALVLLVVAPSIAAAQPLVAPELPVVPGDLVDRVASLRITALDTLECYTVHGDRMEHVADARCPQWYARLSRGGEASAHAIGGLLASTDAEDRGALISSGGNTIERLTRLLARTNRPEAVPYLVAALVGETRGDDRHPPTVFALLDALAEVTGNDLVPVAPWLYRWSDDGVDRIAAARTWAEWWSTNRARSRDEWVDAGETAALTNLAATDPATRFAAVQRLATARSHRTAVRASISDLLARTDLTSNVRMHVTRWARRKHLLTPGRTRPATSNTLARTS